MSTTARGLVKRSISIAGHRTSVALEPAFWCALEDLAAQNHKSLAGLITTVDATRTPAVGLASALRLTVLTALQEQAQRSPKEP